MVFSRWMNAMSDLTDLEYKFNGTNSKAFATSMLNKGQHAIKTNSVLINKIKGYQNAEGLSKNFLEDSKKSKWPAFDCGFRGFTLSSSFVKLVAEDGRLLVAHNSAGP